MNRCPAGHSALQTGRDGTPNSRKEKYASSNCRWSYQLVGSGVLRGCHRYPSTCRARPASQVAPFDGVRMSLVNAVVTRQIAQVVVDTEACAIGPGITSASRFSASKMVPLVHANVLFAGRGAAGFMLLPFFAVSMMQLSSFDEVVHALDSKVLRETVEQIEAQHRAVGAPKGFDYGMQEVHVFGWSDKLGSMCGFTYYRDPGELTWEKLPVLDSAVQPWGDEWGQMPEPRNEDQLRATSIEQVAHTRRETPELAIGGKLLLAELTKSTMVFRTLCRL